MLGPGKKGQSKGVRRSQQREEVLQLEADLVKPDKTHSTQQLSVRFECAKLRCPRGCVYAGIQVFLHVFLALSRPQPHAPAHGEAAKSWFAADFHPAYFGFHWVEVSLPTGVSDLHGPAPRSQAKTPHPYPESEK